MVVVVTVMMVMMLVMLVMMGQDDSVENRRKCIFVLRSPFSLLALLHLSEICYGHFLLEG